MYRQRALSYRQIRDCEEAEGSVCHCRCGGLLHGILRSKVLDRSFFESLPADDPHRLLSEPEREERRARWLCRK